jgi:hypothetical protein
MKSSYNNQTISNFQGSTLTSCPTYTPSYLENTIVNKLSQRYEYNRDERLEITLKVLDLENLIGIFVKNKLNFNDLLFLSKDDLLELELSLVARNRVLRFAEAYRQYGREYNLEEIFNFFNKFKSFVIKHIPDKRNYLMEEQPKQLMDEVILPTAAFNNVDSNKHRNNFIKIPTFKDDEDISSPKFNNARNNGYQNIPTFKGDEEISSPKFNDMGKLKSNIDDILLTPNFEDEYFDENALSDYCNNRGSESEERASQTLSNVRDRGFDMSNLQKKLNDIGKISGSGRQNFTNSVRNNTHLSEKNDNPKISDKFNAKTKDKLNRNRKNYKIQKEYVNIASEVDNYLKSFNKLKEKSDDRQNRLKCLIKKSSKSKSRSRSHENSKLGLKKDDLELEEERNLNNELGRLFGRINLASNLDLDNQSQQHLSRIKSMADLNKNFKMTDIKYINKVSIILNQEIDKLYELIDKKKELQINLSKFNQSILDNKKVNSFKF